MFVMEEFSPLVIENRDPRETGDLPSGMKEKGSQEK